MASDESQGYPEAKASDPQAGRIRALALDPGGTTGYAICDINNSLKISWDQSKMSESELMELMEVIKPDIIICEDFEYRNKARAGLDLTPPRLIGVVKLYSQGTCDLLLQKASAGKGHYSDTRLKSIGLYTRGTPHGRDALRHLLHWLTFRSGYRHVDILNTPINILPMEAIIG